MFFARVIATCVALTSLMMSQASNAEQSKSAYQDNDRVENLVDNSDNVLRNLEEMDRQRLDEAYVPNRPWSAYHWPNYMGMLANRYSDPQFVRLGGSDWTRFYRYIRQYSPLDIWQSKSARMIDRLSPAEKYDILMGDQNFTFTKAMWKTGEDYMRTQGRVETWMGICDGWAAASIQHPRPERVVSLLAADGQTQVTFYPTDIKALASALWARNFYPSRFIGKRCDSKAPLRDRSTHLLEDECLNTNPGTWHMAAVNQIGISKRSFVMDVVYDYQVWNHPLIAYEYSYYNLATRQHTRDLRRAKVRYSRYVDSDRFAKFRPENIDSIVGVEMKAYYLTETPPNHKPQNSPKDDTMKVVTLSYDLELDSEGNILGGEWYTKNHPDFLWIPERGHQIRTEGDALAVSDYKGRGPVPSDWQAGALATSRAVGSPLGKVVELLVKISSY